MEGGRGGRAWTRCIKERDKWRPAEYKGIICKGRNGELEVRLRDEIEKRHGIRTHWRDI